MKNSKVDDCSVIRLNKINNRAGNITIVESGKSFPFHIQRIYYLYDIPSGEARGGHGHKALYQLIIAASGSFDVHIDDGTDKRVVRLSKPDYGLILVPGIWRELNDFSSGSVCLVLASNKYDESDYIRYYTDFIQYKVK
jgi:hypothetical protein